MATRRSAASASPPLTTCCWLKTSNSCEQVCSWAHVAFDDESVADFFDRQVDAGRRPEQFGRIWVHTHPGDCPRPSATDEDTFDRVFGRADWALMFILAREGASYARLRFNAGPSAQIKIPVDVDYARLFGGCDADAWEKEYLEHVRPQESFRAVVRELPPAAASPFDESTPLDWYDDWFDYAGEDDHLKGEPA